MRVGIVGCGYWGSKHVRVMSGLSSVESVIAIDPIAERAAALQRAFPRLETATDLSDALDRVDAVIVATPPRTHAGIAADLLRAGKHVLVEKPMTTNVADARVLVALAESAGLVLMAGHTFEYNVAVHALRDLVNEGGLGRIYYIDTARLNLGLYQSDVNVIWDLAPHDISIINHVLGTNPTAVQAWASAHAGSQHDDVAYIRLEYGHVDVTANVHVSWLDPCKVRRVTVVGSDRMAVYNDLNDDERLRIYDKGVDRPQSNVSPQMPMSYRYGGVSSPYIDFTESLANMDQHFIDCVTIGEQCQTSGMNGLAVVRVLDAAERSLREGRMISLGEDLDWPPVGRRAWNDAEFSLDAGSRIV